MDKTKMTICTFTGFIASAFGGWDKLLQVFCLVVCVEMLTGLMKAFSGKSEKSASGYFSSTAFREGLFHKMGMFLLILLATQLGGLVFPEPNFARNACLYALTFMELSSIIENLGLLGVPVPSIFNKILEVLKARENQDNNKDKGEE